MENHPIPWVHLRQVTFRDQRSTSGRVMVDGCGWCMMVPYEKIAVSRKKCCFPLEKMLGPRLFQPFNPLFIVNQRGHFPWDKKCWFLLRCFWNVWVLRWSGRWHVCESQTRFTGLKVMSVIYLISHVSPQFPFCGWKYRKVYVPLAERYRHGNTWKTIDYWRSTCNKTTHHAQVEEVAHKNAPGCG